MVRSFQPGVADPVLVSTILARKRRFSITDLKGARKSRRKTPLPNYSVSKLNG
jgi:hypothetical protein